MRRVRVAWLLMVAALEANNYIHAEPSNKVFRKVAGYRLASVSILGSSDTGSVMGCAMMCDADDCHAFMKNTTTCLLLTYSVNPLLVSDPLFDLYISSGVILPLRTPIANYWGDWQERVLCPSGQYVYGFTLYAGSFAGVSLNVDDCGVTGVELLCVNPSNTATPSNITYKVDYNTTKRQSTVTCPSFEAVDSFRVKVAPMAGTGDDTALIDLKFTCQQTRQEIFSYVATQEGTESEVVQCPVGRVVCGIGARVQIPSSSIHDNTCFNNVAVQCCVV